MSKLVDKHVNLNLAGLGGNVFVFPGVLMGSFRRQAKLDGWTEQEIKTVLDECMKGDYNHMVATMSEHCVNGGAGMDECEDDFREDGEEQF